MYKSAISGMNDLLFGSAVILRRFRNIVAIHVPFIIE
jgi:hypothetical protein